MNGCGVWIIKIMSDIKSVSIVERAVEVLFEDGTFIKFEDFWLRDHCRCSKCYHADTYQRSQHILDIPDTVVINVQHSDHLLSITWDDGHKSNYPSEFLYKFEYKKWTESNRLKPVLWRGAEVASKVATVHLDKFLNSLDGARRVFQSLLDYGVVFIEGVEPNIDATEKVCQALGGVQHTFFGGMWNLISENLEQADTAYTKLPLATHNDNTYFTEAAGLQILHGMSHGGTGGNTILVDGFYGAIQLKIDYPEDFEFLATFDQEAEFKDDEKHHHKYSAPIIRLDCKTKDVTQIRFNVYDRSAMAFADGEQCRSYYRSLRHLAEYYQDTNNQWQFKLQPGVVMAIDNFRLLHGRTGFTGSRILCGSYVSRSDWLDRARTLGLIQ